MDEHSSLYRCTPIAESNLVYVIIEALGFSLYVCRIDISMKSARERSDMQNPMCLIFSLLGLYNISPTTDRLFRR